MGVGEGVNVGVNEGVMVGVEVCVGINVLEGIGVSVRTISCPGSQPEIIKHRLNIRKNITRLFVFIVILLYLR